MPRSKAFRFRDQVDDPQTTGMQLGVRALLSGRVTKRGNMLSIRAELIDVAKDAQLWGAQFNRNPSEAVEVHEEIARCVMGKLEGPSSAGSRKSKAPRTLAAAPVNKEAHQLFLRGAHHANKWTSEGLQQGIELFRQAIDADPMYAPPYASMAIAHAILTVVGKVDTVGAFRQAKAYARRAIELDDTLSEAHAALGITLMFCDFNITEALREGKKALELNSNSCIARYAYAQSLAASNRLEDALDQAREGCEIDPLMAPINYCYGLLLYYHRQWQEAEVQLQRTLEINPNFIIAQAMVGIVLARQGRFADAMAHVKKMLIDKPDTVWELVLGYVAALAGERAIATRILAKRDAALPAAAAYFAATIYGVLGELEKGFADLKRARDLRFGVLASADVNPALDPFRSDPRWPEFFRSLNFGIDHDISSH